MKLINRIIKNSTSTTSKISFSAVGNVRISTYAGNLLGLKPEDFVSLFQDEEQPKNWYLAITDSKVGVSLRKSSLPSFEFSNAGACKCMLDCLGVSCSVVMLLSTVPVEEKVGDKVLKLYPIITKSFKESKPRGVKN